MVAIGNEVRHICHEECRWQSLNVPEIFSIHSICVWHWVCCLCILTTVSKRNKEHWLFASHLGCEMQKYNGTCCSTFTCYQFANILTCKYIPFKKEIITCSTYLKLIRTACIFTRNMVYLNIVARFVVVQKMCLCMTSLTRAFKARMT